MLSRFRTPRWRRLLRPGFALLLGCSLAVLSARAEPVVHEFIEANPSEDLELQATAFAGKFPAAIETPSGPVLAPDPDRKKPPNEVAYGGSSTPNSSDATYRIDRDTTRPDLVSYDDPFVPAVTPFKRLYAFDRVDEDLELVVRDKTLHAIEVGGDSETADDQFFADMSVDLASNEAVRIPSVGPGARVLKVETRPATKVELLRDGADNWFIRADERKRVRLLMYLALARATFGSEFADVAWADLERDAPALPQSVRPAALDVATQIGITRALQPKAAVAALVQHFRSFSPSDAKPRALSGVALYKELALSQKGVCRHRAYAFVITALGLGIPARLVRNEAHAWVEVYDGRLWHRTDLGGAAGRLDYDQDPSTQLHQPPTDPYRWPEGSESGRDMTERSIAGSGQSGANSGKPRAAGAASGAPNQTPQLAAADAGPSSEPDSRPPSQFQLSASGGEIRRGAPLKLGGTLEADGNRCSYARVDVSLRTNAGRLLPLGALATNAEGLFDGAVTIPLSVEVGDYDIVVSTPGDSRCGPGRSE